MDIAELSNLAGRLAGRVAWLLLRSTTTNYDDDYSELGLKLAKFNIQHKINEQFLQVLPLTKNVGVHTLGEERYLEL